MEEGRGAGPGLLASLAAAYFRVDQIRRGFDKLRELCERFPASEYTPVVGLLNASAAVVNNPEFDDELTELVARVANAAPENSGLREVHFRLATKVRGVPLTTLWTMAARWIHDQPASMEPHYMVATAMAREPALAAEAEAEMTKAIELSLQPHPFDFAEQTERQKALRLRSQLRAQRGDVPGAIADARMAQLVASDKAGADDLSTEAALWLRLGYGRKAESLAIEAYLHGSLEAEALLKNEYVVHGENAEGFETISSLHCATPTRRSGCQGCELSRHSRQRRLREPR